MLNTIISLFQGLILVKVAFLIVSALYTVFLLILHNQSKAMQKVINDDGASDLVNHVALINLFVGISIFVAALIIL